MVSIPLCQIWMVSSNDKEKFFLKVERGTKPRLKLFEESRKAQITIPYDHSTKWPALRAQMTGGLTIVVQRLEQQYKITVQHMLERKPDVCVFVNAMAHERDVKTSVREMNTQLMHVGVAGPNLEVTGRIKALKVTFESTVGALHTNAKLSARSVSLNAQHIFIKPEAVYSCSKLRMISRRVQIDGNIYPWEAEPDVMSVSIDASLLHIGVDGVIGALRASKEKTGTIKSPEMVADVLKFLLKGSLANYGKISSKSEMEFRVDGSILSLKDGRIDSATRGYTALKQIKGIVSETSASLPTSSKLSTAIMSENPDTVAQLLEDGVDPNDFIMDETTRFTPRKIATKKYYEIRNAESRNKLRENITLIQALMSTHDWRRGLITSNTIEAKVGRDCADCAQFRATILSLWTGASAKCEVDSIWTSGFVTLFIGTDLILEGQVKHQQLDATCGGSVMTTEDGIISEETSAKIVCSSFCSSGIWSVGEHMSINAQSATFLSESYLEVDIFEAKLEGNCQHGGTWQAKFVTIISNGNILTLHNGKVLIDETAQIDAVTFNCSGVWKVTESAVIKLKGSANYFSPARMSANLLKMITEGHCTISGHINVEHMLCYVRNDIITTSTGRVSIGVGATVAAGAFRNDATWISECNLHLHAACFEQSEDAMILAKDTLNFAIYDESIERSQGRIIANYCIMKINKEARFDGYLRVNQIEIHLPYVNESRCIIGGQLEVLAGPLILKGHSEFSGSPTYSPHSFPAFVLEGQLKAEAVIAPFMATRFSSSSYSLLSGMESIAQSRYRTLISVGALYTMRASLIDSVSCDAYPEAILCATTWVHEGQIRFRGDSTFIVVDSFVNRGRLTNDGKLHNHMKEAFLSIANYFKNEAVLSADKINITGDGELHNKNRIFATDTMNIRLSNFTNETGHMQSENMKLLSAGREWTKINGRIEARGNLDISASKLCMALKNFEMNKQVRISARAQLLVSSDVIDERANIALAARDAIIFDARIMLDVLELTIGASYETEVIVNPDKYIEANHLRIAGKCKFLTLVIEGVLSCGSIVLENTIKNVKITGKGLLICKRTLNISGETATFTLTEMKAAEILGSALTISPITHLKLLPVEDITGVTLYADLLQINGRILMEGKLSIKMRKGTAQIDGEIMGTNMESELSIESDDLILCGYLANLEFFEIYAKKRIEYCDTAIIKNIRSSAMEAQFIVIDGKIINCDSIIATGDDITIDGSLISERQMAVCSVFGKTIRFDGTAHGISRLELNSRGDLISTGSVSDIGCMEIDAKWVNFNGEASNCGIINITSYSCIIDGNIECDSYSVSSLGSIFNICSLNNTQSCSLCSPFIFSISSKKSLPDGSSVCALVFINDKPCNILNPDRIYMTIYFDANGQDEITNNQMKIWECATRLLNDSFRSQSINLEEMLFALKYTADIHTVYFKFPKNSQFYNDIVKMANKFRVEHISVFSCSKLIQIMCDYETKLKINNAKETNENAKQIRFGAEPMHDLANRFRLRSKKYSPRSPRSSADDGGYASRSSSEDIGEKVPSADSPVSSFGKDSRGSPTKLAGDTFEEIEKEIDENSKSFPAIRVLNVSSDDDTDEQQWHDESEHKKENETSFVLNGDRRIPIGFIDFARLDLVISKPRFTTPRRTLSKTDLAMKKIKVKAAISNMDLRSFGSESSLASFDTRESATPIRLMPSPLKRSLIPRSSFRRPYTPGCVSYHVSL